MGVKPVLSPDMVKDFVGTAHGDFERVKEMLAEEPALLDAAHDWGGGDWETGLGAASHMGRRDIAEHLLHSGARMDIFAAAMLGRLEIVQAIIEAQPEAATAPGPHGIPLMNHAERGGEEAARVVDYLRTLSLK